EKNNLNITNITEDTLNVTEASEDPLEHTTFYPSDYTDQNIILLCVNEDLQKGVFIQVLYYLVFIFSVLGNGLVLYVLVKYRKLNSVTNIFVLNLAISDLLFAISLPFWAVDHATEWIFGNLLCKVMSGVYFLGFYSCILFLLVMTIDRYLAVVHVVRATRGRKNYCAITVCVIIWCVCILVTVPEFVLTGVMEHWDGHMLCVILDEDNHRWKLWGSLQHVVCFFLVPFAIIVYCYARIIKRLISCRTHRKHKAVKVILIIIAVFFLCWAPYNVIVFFDCLEELGVPLFQECEEKRALQYSYYIIRNITYFHCCLNPILYAFVGTEFRKSLTHLFCRSTSCKKMQERTYTVRNSTHSCQ
uniref:G-protein coupled receptors family 1 profile domain-containing protein n=2 Tax=Latimeria chalumnae TaxID=7897 RepID=H3AQE3_LATCH